MTEEKKITSERIIELFMDHVLTGETLTTVYAFSKKYNFEESDFYQYYSSFDALEKDIFAIFCSKTLTLLLENEEYINYNSKNKLLSFYYTFFELLSLNRSYVFLKLNQNKNTLKSLRLLSKLKVEFNRFISKEIHEDKIDFRNETINKIQDKGFIEVSWLQLLFTLKFWLEDESNNFEKTDIFIEKAVKLSFDLRNIAPVQSAFDFAKFLWKEKGASV